MYSILQVLAFNLCICVHMWKCSSVCSQNYKEVHERKEILRMAGRIVEQHMKAERVHRGDVGVEEKREMARDSAETNYIQKFLNGTFTLYIVFFN